MPFSIIIGSDPQLYWHLNNEKVSDFEIEQLNGNHVAAMNGLIAGENLSDGYKPLPNSGQLSDGSLGLYATYEDAGGLDTHSVTLDWGDGTVL